MYDHTSVPAGLSIGTVADRCVQRASAASAEVAPRSVTTGATNLSPSGWSTKHIYVGSVALDWLTLTTFDRVAFAEAVRLIGLHTVASARVEANVMQYRGAKGDGYFFGAGFQAGVEHFMLRLSGSVAQSFFLAAVNYPRMLERFKATRIDVQYTHDGVPDVRLGEVGELLRVAEWASHKGRRPKVDYFSNDDGLDTLYIGSRSSVRLQRIYVKPIDNHPHLRWEVEYKEDLAVNLWSVLLQVGVSALPGILSGEMAVVPLAACSELALLAAAVGAMPVRLKLRRDDGDAMSSVCWLYSSVLPCVRRLQSEDSKVQYFVREFLLRAFLGDGSELPPVPPGLDVNKWLDEWELNV